MSFKDDISEAKSKELNYFHKANEDFADDIIESNTECWNCHTDIPMGKKYCEIHCGHPADEFDSFTGQCKGCGKSLNVNMMMTMPSSEAKSTEAKIERSDGSMTIDGKQVIKIWESMQGWYWYAVEDQGEYTGVGADGNDVQAHAWFGYVQADFNEWGTFDSKELERAGVWTVPKSNWGWTGRMEESYASEDEINTTCRMCRSPQTVPTGSTNEDYLTEPFECMSCGHMFKLTDPYIVGKNRRSGESKASESRKLNARQKKLIEEWVGSMSSPPMVITSDDLPYSLLSELRDINDFDGFDSAIMRYASDIGNKQAMQGSNPYMHSSNYGSFESKVNEGFIKDMNLNKDSLRNYDLDSLINMWKDAQAYYQNPDNTWEDEDAEFYDELAVVINEKKSSAGESVCSKCNGSGDYCVECPRCSGTGVSNESKANESEDVFMYDGTGDSDGVGYWWDFELPVDQMKHEQLSSILGIDINTAWGFMTPAEQDRIRNYKLNKSMTNEAQLMKEINDGWEFSVIDHGYGGGNKIDGVGNSPDVGLLEVGIFSPDTGDINGQKSAVQGYMTQADVDGLLSTFRTDPAVAFRSIGGEWTFAGQKGLEYQSHYSDMSDITWRDIETMEGSMTLLERNMWLENRFDEITSEDFRRLADTARDD